MHSNTSDWVLPSPQPRQTCPTLCLRIWCLCQIYANNSIHFYNYFLDVIHVQKAFISVESYLKFLKKRCTAVIKWQVLEEVKENSG